MFFTNHAPLIPTFYRSLFSDSWTGKRYLHHRGFLRSCQERDLVPHGLQVRKTANIVKFSENFERRWNEVLLNASKEMRELVLSEVEIAIELTTREILKLETSIENRWGHGTLREFNDKIAVICDRVNLGLSRRRVIKINWAFYVRTFRWLIMAYNWTVGWTGDIIFHRFLKSLILWPMSEMK